MFRRILEGLNSLIYPATCISCKGAIKPPDDGTYLCAGCLAKIRKNRPPFCLYCGRQLEKRSLHKAICPGCLRKTLHFDRAFSPCVYEGVTKDLIHKFKYGQKEYLGGPLSDIMIEFIKQYRLPVDFIDCVIPVPLSRARRREREFNQSEVLAGRIAAGFGKPLITGCLKRCRHSRRQTEVDPHERFANVSGSFSVADAAPVAGKNILLVDDVLTTGATSSEAAAALKRAGAGIVFVLTAAS